MLPVLSLRPVRTLPALASFVLSLALVALTTFVLIHVQNILIAREGHYVRPYGIAFVVPVALLTIFGASRFGFLTLFFCLASTSYVLTKPHYSFAVTEPLDYTELCFLLLVGSLVVFGIDAMRKNAQMLLEMQQATLAMQQAAEQQKAFLRDVLSSVTEKKLRLCDTREELPGCVSLSSDPVPVTPQSLRLLRQSALSAAEAQGLSPERCHDLVTAVGEAAMNAVVHGGGGEGRVCLSEEGSVQVWIEDKGAGITLENLPKATLERGHSTAGTLGHGFWMILNTIDRLWLLTGKEGTTIVLEQSPTPPAAIWT